MNEELLKNEISQITNNEADDAPPLRRSEQRSDEVVVRLKIILSFWFVIILSLPIWWKTTEIERRILPTDEVRSWNKTLSSSCPIRFPIKLSISPLSTELTSQSIKNQIQKLQSSSSKKSKNHSKIDFITLQCLDFEIQIDHQLEKDAKNKAYEILSKISPVSSSSVKRSKNKQGEEEGEERDSRMIKYSSDLKLIFSLMNEDINEIGFIQNWEIKQAIEKYLARSLSILSPLHNFTCHTQILYHSPLAIQPKQINNLKNPIDQHVYQNLFIVEEEDLKAFINDADWKLASPVTMDPVLHFILWVPSSKHRPFKIRKSDGTMDRDGSFIRPQWGSLMIYNPFMDSLNDDNNDHAKIIQLKELERPFELFRYHLMNLLGFNNDYQYNDDDNQQQQKEEEEEEEEEEGIILGLDHLIRKRIIEGFKETINSLNGIIELVSKLKNIRVSQLVQDQIKSSLVYLNSAKQIKNQTLFETLKKINRSNQNSLKSFYNPTMLSLLYFPDEHKYAIYTPLFGPIFVPLLFNLFKVFKKFNKVFKDQKKIKME